MANKVFTTLAAAKAKLADVRAEHAQRRQTMLNALDRLRTLEPFIMHLQAEQELDGIDHSSRIAAAQDERQACEVIFGAWQGVDDLLTERIAAAECVYLQALEADRQQQLARMDEQEAELRSEFATASFHLFEIAAQIGDIHAARDAMRTAMLDELHSGQRQNMAGAPVNAPLPAFPIKALFHRSHLDEALRTLRNA